MFKIPTLLRSGELGTVEPRQPLRVDGMRLHVQRNVDPDRPGPPGDRQVRGLFEMVADALGIRDRDGILGDRSNDGDDVDLLHAHLPDAQRCAVGVVDPVGTLHLPGDEEARGRIEPRASHPGDRVGPAGAGRHQRDAQMIRRLGVVFGGDGTGLFVQIAHELDVHATRQRIVQVHGAAAGHQEHVLDAEIGDEADDVVRELS